MKIVKAVKPFEYPNNSNFKLAVYNKWRELGGAVTSKRYFEKYYKSISFHINLPTIKTSCNEARLRFVEGASLAFDTFPDYLFYEIIPIIWDCWPQYWNSMELFFIKRNVRTAFFTSSQTADYFRRIFPDKNIFHIPEAIETKLYKGEKKLNERNIDYLEFGRCSRIVDSTKFDSSIKVLSSFNEKNGLATLDSLINALADSKVTLTLTRQDNQPELAAGIDTLTQRYWECMLSGVILLGRAPQELIDIIGYDPTIPIDMKNINIQIQSILANVSSYQDLVDKNREIAMRLGDWKFRILDIRKKLVELGYSL